MPRIHDRTHPLVRGIEGVALIQRPDQVFAQTAKFSGLCRVAAHLHEVRAGASLRVQVKHVSLADFPIGRNGKDGTRKRLRLKVQADLRETRRQGI